MEVHHHSHLASGETHTARKKGTHYFWEFLMLFLAVFCGFLAELQLEHYIEHQREKKFAVQLLADLKKDTINYHSLIDKIEKDLVRYDSVNAIFKQKSVITDDEFVRLTRRLYTTFNFFTISTTFNQMKYSGGLRYIKEDSLVMNLTAYYDQLIPRITTLFGFLDEKLHTQIEPFFAAHFDLNVTTFYWEQSLPANLRYYNRSENSDLLIKNYFQLYYNGVSIVNRQAVNRLNSRATKLIEILEKEYGIN